VLAAIRSFRPHILMVGMGMPRQEHWILDNLDEIEVRVILTAGACMDYVAGAVPTPPRWMGRWGLEWLFRLGSDPTRLWRRYLIEPWFVFRLFIRDLLARS
jgi:N-acetylglucosaminyldiphosphoundecaprenol N-acetyl-beta-D-mannosaminyltransferase